MVHGRPVARLEPPSRAERRRRRNCRAEPESCLIHSRTPGSGRRVRMPRPGASFRRQAVFPQSFSERPPCNTARTVPHLTPAQNLKSGLTSLASLS
jgi:hypothetical protein